MCTVKPKAPKKQCMTVVYAMELVKENLIKMVSGTNYIQEKQRADKRLKKR